MNDLDPTLVLLEGMTHDRICRAIVNAANGCDHHPSSGNGGGQTKGSHSDPTGNLVERHMGGTSENGSVIPSKPDKAAADLTQAVKLVKSLRDFVDSWAPNNAALAHKRAMTPSDDGCRSCDRVKRDGIGHWERVHARGMCKQCGRAVATTIGVCTEDGLEPWTDNLPPEDAIREAIATGKYITASTIRRHVRGRRKAR